MSGNKSYIDEDIISDLIESRIEDGEFNNITKNVESISKLSPNKLIEMGEPLPTEKTD